jgi:hypothetical protein
LQAPPKGRISGRRSGWPVRAATNSDVINRRGRLVKTIVVEQIVQKRFNDLGVDASVLRQGAFANMIRWELKALPWLKREECR